MISFAHDFGPSGGKPPGKLHCYRWLLPLEIGESDHDLGTAFRDRARLSSTRLASVQTGTCALLVVQILDTWDPRPKVNMM